MVEGSWAKRGQAWEGAAQAAHHACSFLSGHVACPHPTPPFPLHTHTAQKRALARGSQLASSQTSSQAQCQGSLPACHLRRPPPTTGRTARLHHVAADSRGRGWGSPAEGIPGPAAPLAVGEVNQDNYKVD